MFIKHSFLKIKLFLKLGIFFNSHILAKRVINFNNYIFGLRSTRAILNINKSIFLLYRTLLLLQLLVINNGKILFIEKNRAVSSLITSKTNAINQFCISGDS
jgi:ribosomal protein S2